MRTIWPGLPPQNTLKINDTSSELKKKKKNNSKFNGQRRRWSFTGPAALKRMRSTLSLWLSFTCLYQMSAALILLIPVNGGGAKPLIAFYSFLPQLLWGVCAGCAAELPCVMSCLLSSSCVNGASERERMPLLSWLVPESGAFKRRWSSCPSPSWLQVQSG